MQTLRFASALLLAAAAALGHASATTYTGLYVLGDSLSDQGNLLAATSALGPGLGQPPQPDFARYDDGRFSNGPVYPEVLASDLGVSIGPSLLGGTNFAFGGARTDYNTVEVPPYGTQVYPRAAYPWSLNGEVAAFQARVAATGADPNALYVVFSGSNDVGDILSRRLDPATTIANAVAGVINAVDAFKAAGARTVLVPNLPDLGVVPSITQLESTVPGISALAASLTAQFNAALSTALDGETGIRVVQFDTFDLLRDVVANPGEYGFSNATQPCYSGFVLPDPNATVCADPGQYVFWDMEHPTAQFHALLGNELFQAVEAVPEPGSLGLVACGLAAALGLARRRVPRSPEH
jgi:outer membrane lipase/esterase